jgi:hypothetical protein
MTGFARLAVLSSLALSLGICAAQVADLTGIWKLNVQKSSWGKRAKVVSALVNIEHREPSVKYSGTVVDAQQEMRQFAFEGRIDGKQYPTTTSYGEGKVTLSRVDQRTVRAELRSNDGRSTQSITTTVSRDGRVMTRWFRFKTPDGTVSWTEVYEKQ